MPQFLQDLRQTAAEYLAITVCDLFPNTQLLGGHCTDFGFYYDFSVEQPLDEQALLLLEERMRFFIKENIPIQPFEMMRENAANFFQHHGQTLRAYQISEQPENIIQLVKIGDFYDLCSPPYLNQAKGVTAFKLLKVTFHTISFAQVGELKVTRIQGTAFPTSEDLKKFLKMNEAAKKRDHRVIGKEMNLFSAHEEIGVGSWLWHPKGARLREILLDWWRQEHRRQRFEQLATPQVVKAGFLKKSGIYDSPDLASGVFPSFVLDGYDYAASPSQIPLHAWAFRLKLHSYRELPIRYAECTQLYNQGKESQLWGMMRARSYCADAGNVFCAPNQVQSELISSLQFIDKTIKIFGFGYHWYLVDRGQKFAGTIDGWIKSIDWIVKAVEACGFKYEIDKMGKSFSGPRLEAYLTDSLGRSWKGPSISIDFNYSERFGLRYQGPDDEMHMPVMITRAMFGSLERFVAVLIEHYGGLFPVWLAPEQVRVIPIAEKHMKYAAEVHSRIEEMGFRTSLDHSRERLGGKIHSAERERVPYAIVLGDKEENSGLISVRSCNHEEMKSGVKLEAFLERLSQEEVDKSLPRKSREPK